MLKSLKLYILNTLFIYQKIIMKLELQTETIIPASIKCVWQTLTCFAKYEAWNPFIPSIKGNLIVGEKLTIEIKPVGLEKQTFRPDVLKVVPQQEIRWAGVFLFSWLFRGEHYFILEPVNEHTTKLIHGEVFSGRLVKFFVKRLKGATYAGFLAMNEALTEQAIKA